MTGDREILGEGRFLRLCARESWEYCERKTGNWVIAVVAVTPERELLLVEQFRPALRANVIELPAGLVGDEESEESKESAAARELEEETGYRAERLVALMEGPTSSGMSTEQVAMFGAYNLMRTGPGGGAGNERIAVHAVPLARVPEFLDARMRDGTPVDPKVYAGLYFANSPA